MDKTNASWLKTFSIGFSIISFGITIAIVGYIVLTTKQIQPANQPSPTSSIDETANWKTYTDARLKFTIKYPNNVVVFKSFTEGGVVFTSEENKNVSFQVLLRNGTNPEKALESETPKGPGCDNAPINTSCNPGKEPVEVSNGSGLRAIDGNDQNYYHNYYLVNADKSLVVRVFWDTYPDKNYFDIFQKMFSTFKFTQ